MEKIFGFFYVKSYYFIQQFWQLENNINIMLNVYVFLFLHTYIHIRIQTDKYYNSNQRLKNRHPHQKEFFFLSLAVFSLKLLVYLWYCTLRTSPYLLSSQVVFWEIFFTQGKLSVKCLPPIYVYIYMIQLYIKLNVICNI